MGCASCEIENKHGVGHVLLSKDGLPAWSEESTKAVKNALEVYSSFTFDYPYPVAISVNTSEIGMEFPMISFNGGRPGRDGSMSEASKQGMIGTIVHEVGHNYFPMIVSSDERQWFWMDEGLNTFLQEMTEEQRYGGGFQSKSDRSLHEGRQGQTSDVYTQITWL